MAIRILLQFRGTCSILLVGHDRRSRNVPDSGTKRQHTRGASSGISGLFQSCLGCSKLTGTGESKTMDKNDYTGLLFARPSIAGGIARSLDVGGTFDQYNYSASSEEADQAAIASDWYAVGADLYRAISRCMSRSKPRHGRRAKPQ